MAIAVLKNADTGELVAVDNPSTRYTKLTSAPASASDRGVAENKPGSHDTDHPARWVDVTADIGQGGSAFAHLAEDADSVIADETFSVGHKPLVAGGGFHAYTDGSFDSFLPAATPDDFITYFIQKDDELYDRFDLWADGSLHFGDGTAAPDVHGGYLGGDGIGFTGSVVATPDVSDPYAVSYSALQQDGTITLQIAGSPAVTLGVTPGGVLTVNGASVAMA